MQFADILGQTELIQKIRPMVLQKQVPHAILLSAPEGAGGFAFAWALAQYITCLQRSEEDACGVCSSCLKMTSMQHPDVHYSFPTIRKDGATKPSVSDDFIKEFRAFRLQHVYGEDKDWFAYLKTEKQGNITAAECRDMIRKLTMRSFESEYKVMIMWCPEYLDNEGNILLKLIEEPTPKTILLLVTTSPERILQTIQSRTQLFPLKRLQSKDMATALEKRGVPNFKAIQYSRIAEGNYQYALTMVNEVENDFLLRTREWLNVLFTNNGSGLMEWITQICELSKEEQKTFLLYFMQLVEHLIRYKILGSDNLLLLADEQKLIDVLLAKGMQERRVMEWSALIEKSLYAIERNANTKILFHSLSLRIQALGLKVKEVERASKG
jgi:DNA polymerase-3 subunit delta'